MKIENECFRINDDGDIELCTHIKDKYGRLIYEGDILENDIEPDKCIKITYAQGYFYYNFMDNTMYYIKFSLMKTDKGALVDFYIKHKL